MENQSHLGYSRTVLGKERNGPSQMPETAREGESRTGMGRKKLIKHLTRAKPVIEMFYGDFRDTGFSFLRL